MENRRSTSRRLIGLALIAAVAGLTIGAGPAAAAGLVDKAKGRTWAAPLAR